MESVLIQGPVLLLMGPIGTFFARFSRHLESRGVPVYKLSLPLHEFGFEQNQRLPFTGSMEEFGPFLKQQIADKKIRHLFMYGDFIDPHRIAIDLVQELKQTTEIDAWVFELGYVRPNYVSLEPERANARSNLNQSVEFYHSLPAVDVIPQARRDNGIRWRKAWKFPTFIQHAFTNYSIIGQEHKLQPRPDFLIAQIWGFLRKFIYKLTERPLRLQLQQHRYPYFLAPLQVSNDSQVSLSSGYGGMEPFIEELIRSFAANAPEGNRLYFKHHPRDRGYNHYGTFIDQCAKTHGVSDRVFYFHDGPLGPILKRSKGVITINSTVGLQALYHSTPVKVMGQTFYDLPGLVDQQPLDGFWSNPERSDRQLFRKFYLYLINKTQVNGNFDGQFPFKKTFEVAPELAIAASGPKPTKRMVVLRISHLLLAVGFYYAQVIALALGRKESARRLLERTARQGLAGMGVRVLIDRRADYVPHTQIHIANHGHALDFLMVQGYFCECGITTVSRHLSWLFPFLEQTLRNYGHTSLNHLSPSSRTAGLGNLLKTLETKGRLFIHPSGSLVTPITTRVSSSLYMLGKSCDAYIVPWFCSYHGFAIRESLVQYKPLAMVKARLFGSNATILCSEGAPINTAAFPNSDSLSKHIRRIYSERQNVLVPID